MSASRIGPFEVVRELGRGGMGVVLEVRHPDLPDRRLALKLISKDAAEGTALVRFSREARLLARVKHPNVVGVHTFATTDDGRPYLVTDLIEGTNLKQVARAAPVDPARASAILRTLAAAVSALHAAGILHRDLKPENVILQPDDTPVLLDFGLAREQDAQRLTQTGTVLGTPAYMSPEQAGGDSPDTIDARCDVYGLGAILFELLAGRPPFDGTAIQIVTAVLRTEPRWPSEDRDDVPADLEAVLRKAMAKEPAARYASAAELGKDLARFAGGERVAAPRPPSRGGAARALVALAALVLIGGVVGGVAIARRGRAPVPPVDVATPASEESARRPRDRSPAPPPAGPEPVSDPDEPVATYRGRLRWLDDAANATHPARKKVLALLSLSREKPLRVIPCPQGKEPTFQLVTRFVSDAQVAVLVYSPTVYVADVDGGRGFMPRWSATTPLDYRLWDVASTPSIVMIAGAYEVSYARHAGGSDGPEPLIPIRPPGEAPGPDDPPRGTLRAVAISPDGTRAVVGGARADAVLFDLTTTPPTELKRLPGFAKTVRVCAFSPDGQRFVLGTEGAESSGHLADVTLWTADGDAIGDAVQVRGAVYSISFTPGDGRLLVSCGFEPLAQAGSGLDALRLEPFPLAPEAGPGSPAAFPLLACGRGPSPRLHGLTRDKPFQLWEWSLVSGGAVKMRAADRSGEPYSMALSPDGTLLAIGGVLERDQGIVELWAAQGR